MSLREWRDYADDGSKAADLAIKALLSGQPEHPVSRMAYWRSIFDAANGEMYAAAADARDAGVPWSGIAIAYDRSEASTHNKFSERTARPPKG